MKKPAKKILEGLASIQLTLFCLTLMMALIVLGTLAQTKMGTFTAQKMYFSSWWIPPFFPGGLTVGSLWLINLVAAFIVKFRYNKKEMGILLSHFGLILLLAGQGLTQLTSIETRLLLQEGETGHFIESPRDNELVFTMVSDPTLDNVVSIPQSIFSEKTEIQTPHLPFFIRIKKYFANAELKMSKSVDSPVTQGIGTQISVREIPVTHDDDNVNNVSAYVELEGNGQNLGTWLVSSALGAPQTFSFDGKEYRLAIRPRRTYLPFQLTLKDFKHDVYPGTDIPKNFSSQIHLRDSERQEDRDVLIYMNHPLRYRGKTFFQASFGNNDTLSVFQVVENPVWLAPYISCLMVILGLAIQFIKNFRRPVASV